MVKPSGNGIHVPLHADGIGTVQFDVQRTGVVHYLLRSEIGRASCRERV